MSNLVIFAIISRVLLRMREFTPCLIAGARYFRSDLLNNSNTYAHSSKNGNSLALS